MNQLCEHGCGLLATHTTKSSLWSGPFKGRPVHQCSKSANSCPAVKQRKISSSQEKYGTDYPWQNQTVLDKRAKSNIEKYGNPCSLLNAEQQIKRKCTMIARYGVEEPLLNKEIKEKAGSSIKKAYITDPTYATRIISTRKEKYGEDYQSIIDKQRETKVGIGLWVDSTDVRLWSNYKRQVKYHTTQSYKQYKHLLNPEELQLGRTSYHIDHILSRKDGFDLKVHPKILSHPANLRVISAAENRKKYTSSLHTLAELLVKIENWIE